MKRIEMKLLPYVGECSSLRLDDDFSPYDLNELGGMIDVRKRYNYGDDDFSPYDLSRSIKNPKRK